MSRVDEAKRKRKTSLPVVAVKRAKLNFDKGDQVAAKILNDWILANVIGTIDDGYEIEDVEDDGFFLLF